MRGSVSHSGSAGMGHRQAPHSEDGPPWTTSRAKRVVLVVLIAVASLNIWTGAPLFALWVGSRIQGGGPPTMAGVFIVAIVLLGVILLLVRVISILQSRYEAIAQRSPTVRTHAPWLRSMRGERKLYEGEKPRLTAPERVLVIVAVIAIAMFEVWFFFFSGSPIDQRSGRGEVPTHVVSIDPLRDVL